MTGAEGYSVREVLDDVSRKLDALAVQIAAQAVTYAALRTEVDALQQARTAAADRGWATIVSLLTGGSGLATGLLSLVIHH